MSGDIATYTGNEILYVHGIFLSDCTSIYDIMEQKLMDDIDTVDYCNSNNTLNYTKLPSRFTGVDTWVKTTDILCWNCTLNFNNMPLFIPRTIEPNNVNNGYIIHTEGCFCSFNCVLSYIITYSSNTNDKLNKQAMLEFLYELIHNQKPKYIRPAPSKYLMKQYGGMMDQNEYKQLIQSINSQKICNVQSD